MGRSRSERAALIRALASALFRHERIQTTVPKAREAQRSAERLITEAKTGTLAARRRVEAWLQDPALTHALFTKIAPRFQKRSGGYTRIVRAGWRHGDGASLAVLELVERAVEPSKRGRVPSPKVEPPPTPPTGEPPAPPKKKPGGLLVGLRKFFRKGRPEGS